MKVIAVANQKGGVAKTTTALALAAVLLQKGYRVLLIDTDPRRDATDTYRAQTEDVATVFDVLIARDKIVESVQHKEQGDILASDKLLENIEQKLTETGREYRLAEAFEEMGDDVYDFVVIDTPPQPGVILSNVLTAAHTVIVPITPDRYALRGVEQLDEAIARVRKYTNPGLKISGFLMTKCDLQLNLTKETFESVLPAAEAMKTIVFDTKIREAVKAKEAQAKCKGLYEYAPDSNPAQDYIAFTEELLKTMEGEV